MKEIIHEFGIGIDWAEDMAKQMGGYMKGKYFIIPSEVHTGTRYVLSVNPDITVMFADVVYNQDVLFIHRNTKNDFVGIYFNLTEGDTRHMFDEESLPMGRLNYNLAIVDSRVNLNYMVKTGAKTYNFCIFIKKSLAKEYFQDKELLGELSDRMFNYELNSIIHLQL